MKKYLILIVAPLLLWTCRPTAVETKQTAGDSLNIACQNLSSQLKDKDTVINYLLASFNQIQNNLNKIKSKEKTLTVKLQDPEFRKSPKNQIIDDIESIYDLLNKNRRMFAAMDKKLKESAVKLSGYENFIFYLNSQLTEKETEITSLKHQLSSLQMKLDYLNIIAESDRKESDLKTDQLNTAWCAIGTLSELKKNGLVIEKGGVLGIGKIKELNPDLKKELLSVVDKNEVQEISIAAKKVKLISPHPSGSYKMEDTRLSIKKLHITKPSEFWSASSYLIIEVSSETPEKPE
jgi:uncharacterized coiled-coil protein SlyX